MKPIPIPDELIPQGAVRATIGAPRGQEDKIHPVEVWQGRTGDDMPATAVLVELDDADLKAIAQDPRIWLIFISSRIVPFSFTPVKG